MIKIPGDYYEGGGQILRTAIALSCLTQKSFYIYNIRGKRPNPGLRAQHLTCFQVAKIFTKAEVEGLKIGSQEVKFSPKCFKPRDIQIDIGTAGSIGLLLQAILIPLSVLTSKEIQLKIKGGTHVRGAVPIDYYISVFLPFLNQLGVKINMKLINQGYYPQGGGEIIIDIYPWKTKKFLEKVSRGKLIAIKGISHASQSLAKAKVAERQKQSAVSILERIYKNPHITAKYYPTLSPGSGIVIWAEFDDGSILGADALGEKGKPAEKVGEEASIKLIKEINSGACIDHHLADNLIPWIAIAGGKFLTSEITLHTKTNIWVTQLFLEKKIEVKDNIIYLKN